MQDQDRPRSPMTRALAKTYEVPDDSEPGTIPMFIELADGEFIRTESASRAQLLFAAKLHYEISKRHGNRAASLQMFAEDKYGVPEEDEQS